jgi:hypothetical protein
MSTEPFRMDIETIRRRARDEMANLLERFDESR